MKVFFSILVACGVMALAVFGSFKLELWNPSLEDLKVKYASAPSQFIVVDGVPLHIRDEGNKDSTLPPLILLNGHLGNLRMWDGWVPILAPHMRLIRMDFPPYGLSGPDPSGVYSTDRAITLLDGLISTLGLTKVNLGGTSNGALVVTIYAIRNPDRVGKLVVSTLPNGRPPKRTSAPKMMQAVKINAWTAPSTSTCGAWSLPIASSAMRIISPRRLSAARPCSSRRSGRRGAAVSCRRSADRAAEWAAPLCNECGARAFCAWRFCAWVRPF